MGKDQHVTPHSKGWQVKGEGNSKATAENVCSNLH
jgi:hypothetical protein